MTRPLQFLLSRGDLTSARKLLVVQSGSAQLLQGAIELVRETYPQAALTVLLRRGLDELPASLGKASAVEFVENVGSRRNQVRALRGRRFEGAFVLYTNEPGYWKLKALPFALGVPTVIAVNENLGCFPVSLRHASRLSGHLRWRLGGNPVLDLTRLVEEVAEAAAAPALLAYLLAYERVANLRARTRGSSAQWKRAFTRSDINERRHD